ncbi:Non-reducing polyketide synthase ausA [Vanrija pseudolonga]|uniref:Non-reducing polyketide synthase ausA n=1 Tax=Vanrija pseudolonga TaxID=143232 RepID=A0AAF0YEE8_9TREE|nr:Non-reducing polyketide synthase ausA [Vanrija pseudolonga]
MTAPTTIPAPTVPPAQAPPGFSDHVYATKHGVELGIRVWLSPVATSTSPWVLWSHGGAFMAATHHTPMPWLFALLQHGVHIASYGYRLAPHAKLRDMLEDSQSALDWARASLPRLAGGLVNVDAYAVAGESAGGCLATLNAQVLVPPPRALLDLYGPSDFTDPLVTRPIPIEIMPDAYSGEFTPEQLEAELASTDLSRAVDGVPHVHLGVESAAEAIDNFRLRARLDNYEYTSRGVLQNDLIILAVTTARLMHLLVTPGADSKTAAWAESPLGRLEKWRGPHPPTIVFHGSADPVVPLTHSMRYARRLRELGTEVEEVYVPNEGHTFDLKYTGPDVPGWDEHIAPLINFALRHLGVDEEDAGSEGTLASEVVVDKHVATVVDKVVADALDQ